MTITIVLATATVLAPLTLAYIDARHERERRLRASMRRHPAGKRRGLQ